MSIMDSSRVIAQLRVVRSSLAPMWRKLVFAAAVVLGICVFVAAEYQLGRLIVADQYILAIIALAAISIFVITVTYPFWGYAIWFFLTKYLTLFGGILPRRYNFDLVMPGLLLFVLLLRATARKDTVRRVSAAEVLLAVFCIYGYLIRKDFSGAGITGFGTTLLLTPLCIYLIASMAIRERKHILWFMIVIVATGTSFALMGIYEQIVGKMWLAGIMGGDKDLYGGMRSTGPTGHYYVYGNMLSLSILLCLHLFRWHTRWLSRLALVAAAIVNIVGLYYGFSRAPYIAFALGMLLMLLLSAYTKRVYAVGLAILAAAVLIAAPLSLANRNVRDRMQTGYGARLATSQTSLNMFRQYPLFGVGRDNYLDFVQTYVSSHEHSARKTPSGAVVYWGRPHSEYFLMLTELGAVGLFLYLMVYLLFLRRLAYDRRILRKEDVDGSDFAALAIAFTIGVLFTMATDEFGLHPYMYAIIFTLYAMARKAELFARKEEASA